MDHPEGLGAEHQAEEDGAVDVDAQVRTVLIQTFNSFFNFLPKALMVIRTFLTF